jgi:hypothetical protein
MRASGYARAANDFYTEPSWIVQALLGVEEFPGVTHDPACGIGTIPKAFHAKGLECGGSDIVDRGFGAVEDFFITSGRVDNIVSNPPFSETERFVERALTIAQHKVAILARLAFLEGVKRRDGFFRRTPLARVWVSSRRVSMPPGGTDIPAKGGSIPFAWFVFRHGFNGEPTIGWV